MEANPEKFCFQSDAFVTYLLLGLHSSGLSVFLSCDAISLLCISSFSLNFCLSFLSLLLRVPVSSLPPFVLSSISISIQSLAETFAWILSLSFYHQLGFQFSGYTHSSHFHFKVARDTLFVCSKPMPKVTIVSVVSDPSISKLTFDNC